MQCILVWQGLSHYIGTDDGLATAKAVRGQNLFQGSAPGSTQALLGPAVMDVCGSVCSPDWRIE